MNDKKIICFFFLIFDINLLLFKRINSKPLILTNEVFDEDIKDTENDPFKGTSIEGKD